MPSPQRGKYPPTWKDIARSTKDAAGWRCVRCGHAHDPAGGHTLTVHHLTGDKGNCRWWNLAALCQRCHLSVQSRIIMERGWLLPHSKWFRPYAAGYYAHVHGLPDDRDYALTHTDALLALGQSRNDEDGI